VDELKLNLFIKPDVRLIGKLCPYFAKFFEIRKFSCKNSHHLRQNFARKSAYRFYVNILKATPHNNDRLTALRATCLNIFGHLTQILLEIRKYSCVEFMQADEKSDCAIHMQSLCGVALKTDQRKGMVIKCLSLKMK